MKHPRKRFELEIPYDAEYENAGPWRNCDGIQTEGDTLEECLENAEVALMDQDGGSCGFVPADSRKMQDAIETAFLQAAREREEAAREDAADRKMDEQRLRKAFGEDV